MKMLTFLYRHKPGLWAIVLEKLISLVIIVILLMLLGVVTANSVYAQDSRNVESSKQKISIDESSYLLNRFQRQNMTNYLDGLQEEYVTTMKAVAKKYRKEAKLKSKKRNQDYAYFGHRHKPKKRKPGKKRMCKECLLIH